MDCAQHGAVALLAMGREGAPPAVRMSSALASAHGGRTPLQPSTQMQPSATRAKMASVHELDDVDAFGLPVGVLGSHPDEFYGAIGRVVCVCAVLEGQVTTLRHTLEEVQQGKFTHEPVTAQIDVARGHVQELPDHDAQEIEGFLDAAEDAFHRRNALVHSSFPAQPDGRIWGHRPTRDRSIMDGTTDTVEATLEELDTFVADLARLVSNFSPVHALARRPTQP